MVNLWASVLAAVLAVGVAGCAGPGEASGLPCASCTYGVPEKKAGPPEHFCVVDGKKVDCRTNPAGCPSCARAR